MKKPNQNNISISNENFFSNNMNTNNTQFQSRNLSNNFNVQNYEETLNNNTNIRYQNLPSNNPNFLNFQQNSINSNFNNMQNSFINNIPYPFIPYVNLYYPYKKKDLNNYQKNILLNNIYFNTGLHKVNKNNEKDNLEECINHFHFLYNYYSNFYNLEKIYLKKVFEHYKYDYNRFINYKIEKDFDLIKDYKNQLNEEEMKMKKDMENEIVNKNFNIQIFIFNKYCFLNKSIISVYIPHVLKLNKELPILTYFLKEKKITIDDFVINYDDNQNCLFIKILNTRLLTFKEGINNNEFGFSITANGERGFLYTTIPLDLLEESILKLELLNLSEKYIGGYLSEKTGNSDVIIKTLISEKNSNKSKINYFEKNEEYLRGMSTQQLILFIIMNGLEDGYVNLPRLIIFENLIDLKGNKIYKNENLQFIEYDSIIVTKREKLYDSKIPLIIQKCFHFTGNNVNEIDINNTFFKLNKNELYFFEIKSALYLNDIYKIIANTISNFTTFYKLFIDKKMVDSNTNINIIFIYDYKKIEFDLYALLKDLLSEKRFNLNFKFFIIYCFPNYSYFSFDLLNKNLKNTEIELKQTKEKLNLNDLELKQTKEKLNLNEMELKQTKEKINKMELQLKELNDKLNQLKEKK